MSMSERVSKLEVPVKHLASFNKVSREQYSISSFEELAEKSALDAFSICSFYISEQSKNAVAAIDLNGLNIASIDMDGDEATKGVAKNLTPGLRQNSVFERKIWNDDLIVNFVKQGFLRKVIGRTKIVESVRIPLSQLAARD